MAKLTKKAEIVNKLRELVAAEAAFNGTKSAELAQTNISGEPCKDTKVTSVSEKTETTNKNDVGPDKLNNEQGYEQKPATDPSVPVASPKSAEDKSDVEKFASNILSQLETRIAESNKKQAELAQTNISGKPGEDTKITSVSDETEKTNKNDVGPDKLNNEQGYEQDKTKDKSAPVDNVKKSEEEAIKIASYNLGAAVVESLIKKAAYVKQAQEKQAELALIKEAGRKDMDLLIANAAAELEEQKVKEAAEIKLAEEQGALVFDQMYKQAQFEAAIEENKQLRSKLAEYYEIEKRAEAFRAKEEKEQEFYKLANYVAETIKRDLAASAAPQGK
jgi:hypothetical protein